MLQSILIHSPSFIANVLAKSLSENVSAIVGRAVGAPLLALAALNLAMKLSMSSPNPYLAIS